MIMRIRYLILFILFFSIVLNLQAPAALAQSPSVVLEGEVTDQTGEPLPGVNVALPEIGRGTSTAADGSFRIEDLPAGTHTIVFSFVGYTRQRHTVTLEPGEAMVLEVSLQPRLLEGETLTVTGTPYASDPLTTPADVDVITGREKFASQQASLGSSLEELAGVSTISTGSQTGKPVIRGLSGERIRVLDDGVAMDYQQYGVRHGPNVDPFTAERIEVVRGAASVQYGSDALGGAVNVISPAIPDALGESPYLQGQALGTFSSNNDELTGGLHLEGAVQRWGLTGTVVRRSAGNMTTPDVPVYGETDNTSAPKFSGELDHTDYDQLNGSLGIGYQTPAGPVSAEYTRWKNSQNFLLPNGRGLGQNLENDALQVKGDLQLGRGYTLKPKLTYSRNLRQSNHGEAEALPRSFLPEEGYAHLDILLESYTGKLELGHPKVGPFSGVAGLVAKHQIQQTRGEEALVPSADVDNVAAYLFEQAELEKWTFSFGARLDTRTQQAEPNEELRLPNYEAGETEAVLEQSYTEFSGSVGATYKFSESWALAANIGRGFRAPSLFNLHVEGGHGGIAAYQVGNPYLDPERSLNTDLSLRWRSSRVKAKATVYRNGIQNYIFLVNSGEFTGPDNEGLPVLHSVQGNARLLGANAQVSAQLLPWLQLTGSFETVDGRNVDESIRSVDELPLLPPTSVKGGVRLEQSRLWKLEQPFLDVQVEHVASKEAAGRYEPFWQFGNDPKFSDFGVASTGAYTLLNVSVGFYLPLGERPVSVQISADNLLDESYRHFLDTYKGYALSPGRNISLRVQVPFQIAS